MLTNMGTLVLCQSGGDSPLQVETSLAARQGSYLPTYSETTRQGVLQQSTIVPRRDSALQVAISKGGGGDEGAVGYTGQTRMSGPR